jgi:NitT/TauT family transport system substrate-binding protein
MKTKHRFKVKNSTTCQPFKSIIFLSLFLYIFAQGGVCLSGQSSPPKEHPLKVFVLPYLSFGPLMIAEEEGFFLEQGLKVEFVRMSRSAQAIPALAQGKLDVLAGTTSFSLFNAMARGARIKIVADKGYIAPGGCVEMAIMARRHWVKNAESPSAELLRGRPMALNPVSVPGFLVEKFLGTLGLTLDDVRVVDLPEAAKIEAFASGNIDFASANEPWITRFRQAGHAALWVSLSEVAPDFQMAFVSYGPNLLDRNPEVGLRFMIAYRKAVLRYNEGKTDRNLHILAKLTGMEADLLRQACWSLFRSDGHITKESLIEFQQWGKKKGFLDTMVPEAEFWDPTFVDKANKTLRGLAK